MSGCVTERPCPRKWIMGTGCKKFRGQKKLRGQEEVKKKLRGQSYTLTRLIRENQRSKGVRPGHGTTL